MPSAQVLYMKAQQEIKQLKFDLYCSKGFTIQQCIDMAMLSLNEEFGFGPAYNKRFEKRFRKVFVEYAELCIEDGKADKDLVYTKEKLDGPLRRIYGEDLKPFDERYEIDNLYFHDSKEDWREK